jgi:arsenite methyltransferase
MSPLNQFLIYDELPLWSAPFGLTLLETVKYKKGMNVLDIGSGGGFPMLELAERLGPGSHVYGIDPSDDAMAMITEKIRLKGISNATLVGGVAEALPFENEFFDLCISNNGLNNVQDQSLSMKECYRVCKPGAQFVTTMNLPYTLIEFYDTLKETLLDLELPEVVINMEDHISQKRKPVEYLRQLIEIIGFRIKTINVDGFKFRYASGTAFLKQYFIQMAFMEPWKCFLPADKTDQILSMTEEKLNAIALEQGVLEMSVPYVCFDCTR